jgi:hypothetical protein
MVASVHIGACSRTVFRATLVGGVESSRKIRLLTRCAAELGGRVSSVGRPVLADMGNRVTVGAAARVTESMTQCSGCAGMIFN